MMPGYYATMLIVIISAHVVLSQDCISYGKTCNNHASCCGGCCDNKTCIHTYRPCFTQGDLCLNHACPSRQECYIFQPYCNGCEAYAVCRDREEKVERIIPP